MKHIYRFLWWAAACASAFGQVDTNSDCFYLMTYFLNSAASGGARLALSSDGVNWQKYKNEAAVITPTVGSGLMRDPMIYYESASRLFHCVWTTGWNDQCIGYSSSTDLKTWSSQTQVRVGAKIANCACCWAPEIFLDDIKDSFMIFWSTETSSAGKRTYYVMTKDFKTFTDPVKFFDPGYTEIDASMLKTTEGKYYLFFKDERDIGKNVHYVYGPTPQGPWGSVSVAITSAGCEGPSAVKIGGEYRVYFDPYGNSDKSYRMVKTANLETSASPWQSGGTIKAGASNFGYSHGNIIEIPRAYVMHLLYNRSLPTNVAFEWRHMQKGTLTPQVPSPILLFDLLGRRMTTGLSGGCADLPCRAMPAGLFVVKGSKHPPISIFVYN
jgi:hypothetical protein